MVILNGAFELSRQNRWKIWHIIWRNASDTLHYNITGGSVTEQIVYVYLFISPFAGLSSTFPSFVKREPWHGQSHECSAGFHFRAQPRCGHRFDDGVIRFAAASKALVKSLGFKILLDGENTLSISLFLPRILSVSSMAADIAPVMPHLLNPVAT